ncbi:hypothetical protein NEF87_000544 [Candidatus Lokiarchaeum ossiferum]|uniref:DUF4386 family protein n=1 Tax=Candidatus Lokiarchaeum ossiferum TaxID=2951803 RepID=A0ABY6HL74_9ARCH|nr:hypothetical protein NEF87_000544 [Candidatus Lokiarchaeum sp. B-35]
MSSNTNSQIVDEDWKITCKIASISVYSQLLCAIFIMIFAIVVGILPETIEEVFEMLETNRFEAILRLDFQSLIIILLMAPVSFGIYAVMKKKDPAISLFLLILILMGVVIAVTNNGALSLIDLSDKYNNTVDDMIRSKYIAAGEAVLAMNEWNGTAWLVSGIFLQGGFLLFHIRMHKNELFSNSTIILGILANGLDLIQHLLHLFTPTLSSYIMIVAGIFYFGWYIFLGKDLYRYSLVENKKV